MKKLLFIILLGLFAGSAFSQTFLRAHRLTVGTREEGKKVQWGPEKITNVLIVVDDDKIKIHSKADQVYRMTSPLERINNTKRKLVRWECIDSKGKVCQVFLLSLSMAPDIVNVGVVYSDLVWYYSTTIN